MLVTHLRTESDFNSFWNESIPQLHGAVRLTSSLYVLWKFKRIDLIKAHVENDIDILNYVEQISGANKEEYIEVVNTYNSLYADKELYVYPYSSTKLFNHMFKNVLPSAQEPLYNYICSSLPGPIFDKYDSSSLTSFKSCILSQYNISDQDLDFLNKNVFWHVDSDFDMSVNLKNFTSCVQNLSDDNKAYQKYVEELELKVSTLIEHIDTQAKEGVNGYLLSWH